MLQGAVTKQQPVFGSMLSSLQQERLHASMHGLLQDEKNPYFGAVVGRVANRIANAEFTLESTTYKLAVNNPPNSQHGGRRGFDKVIWEGDRIAHPQGDAVRLQHISRHGEEVCLISALNSMSRTGCTGQIFTCFICLLQTARSLT